MNECVYICECMSECIIQSGVLNKVKSVSTFVLLIFFYDHHLFNIVKLFKSWIRLSYKAEIMCHYFKPVILLSDFTSCFKVWPLSNLIIHPVNGGGVVKEKKWRDKDVVWGSDGSSELRLKDVIPEAPHKNLTLFFLEF